jgi:hypothetical protein
MKTNRRDNAHLDGCVELVDQWNVCNHVDPSSDAYISVQSLAKYQTSDTRGYGWSISCLMCVLVQKCFQTDLSFLLPSVNGHVPRQF